MAVSSAPRPDERGGLGVEFNRAADRPQADLGLRAVHAWSTAEGEPWATIHRSPQGYVVRFHELADFDISAGGARVCAHAVPDVEDSVVEHLFLNQVVPLALSWGGRLAFHASAVECGSGAIAFMGPSGRGKSTLAASFAAGGVRFLTDDGLFVEASDSGATVLPGHPSMRLWPDSEGAILGGTRDVSSAPKVRFFGGERLHHCANPRPLRGIYLLGEDAEIPAVRTLAPAEAVVELVRHSFLLDVEAAERLAIHFDGIAALARRGICHELRYPRRFADLAVVRTAITAHDALQP